MTLPDAPESPPPLDFMIAGERRAGTTTLHRWLSCSPGVAMTDATDSMYFLEEELKGVQDTRSPADAARWEETHTPREHAARLAGLPTDRPRGEKCADLLYWSPAHARLRRFAPQVRLVLTLRDPVTRAWSHYWNEVGKGRESADFETAFDRDVEGRHASDWQRFHLSYARRGCYDESLVRLYETFPAERVLVLILEESKSDPRTALGRVHEFLGVTASVPALPERRVNRNWTTVRRGWVDRMGCAPVERAVERVVRRATARALRGSPERWSRTREVTALALWPFRRAAASERMRPETERRLREHYAPHVERLRSLLGRDAALPWGVS